jgi:hypothetical protein
MVRKMLLKFDIALTIIDLPYTFTRSNGPAKEFKIWEA